MKNLLLNIKYLLIIFGVPLLCICISSCNMSDDVKELSGGYFYQDEGQDSKDILNHLPGINGIYSKVIAYDYNSDFIIAAQQPKYEEFKTMIGFNLRGNLKKYPTNSSIEREKSEIEADSILKHNSYYKSIFLHRINYWIIEHKSRKIYGPLTKEDYTRICLKIGVPKNLELKLN